MNQPSLNFTYSFSGELILINNKVAFVLNRNTVQRQRFDTLYVFLPEKKNKVINKKIQYFYLIMLFFAQPNRYGYYYYYYYFLNFCNRRQRFVFIKNYIRKGETCTHRSPQLYFLFDYIFPHIIFSNKHNFISLQTAVERLHAG